MTLLALAAVVSFAFLTEAIVGFGSTVLTVTLGAHLFPLDVLLPSFVPLNMVLSGYLVLRYRDAVDAALLRRRVLPLVGVGLAVGMVLFRLDQPAILELLFALFVVGLAASDLLRVLRAGAVATRPPPPLLTTSLLLVGGVIHGLFGSGGPMIVYVAGRYLPDKRVFRSTLSLLWLLLNAMLLVNYATLGLLSRETLGRSAALAPALLVGIALGERVHARLPERPFRLLMIAVLLLAGGSLATRTLGRLLA